MFSPVPCFGKGRFFLIAAAAWALGIWGSWAAGCGAPPPCSSSSFCPEGTVCAATGACTPLDPAAGRFTRAVWVVAQDWGGIGAAGTSRDTDLLPIGGDDGQIAYLTFGPIPDTGRVEKAVLVLWPHVTWDPPGVPARLAAYRTESFEGPILGRRNAPRRSRLPVSEAGIAPGATRLLHFDVTEPVIEAQRTGSTEISLAIVSRGDEAAALRFASPRSLAFGRRPRLELTVR
ncbi:MAG: hypothetical protein DRJ42_14465 [Deltaproteobacteria bacterium]|nr:MAG: hypothetical protein DRJ42_14465 [Deltaproteobacteria bacterium]